MAVSSDNKLLATGDMDRLIIIWDTLTMTRTHTFKGHRDAVSGLVFRRGTHTLYSSSHDRSVKIWECDEKAYVETLYGHQDAICGIDAGARERCVTVGGRDGSARVWKIVEESQLVYNGPQSSLDCVKLLNEEHWVTVGEDGHIAVWGLGKLVTTFISYSCLFACKVQRSYGTDASNDDPHLVSALTTLHNTDTVITGSRAGSGCGRWARTSYSGRGLTSSSVTGVTPRARVTPTSQVSAANQGSAQNNSDQSQLWISHSSRLRKELEGILEWVRGDETRI